jgi:hypothetical protein
MVVVVACRIGVGVAAPATAAYIFPGLASVWEFVIWLSTFFFPAALRTAILSEHAGMLCLALQEEWHHLMAMTPLYLRRHDRCLQCGARCSQNAGICDTIIGQS